MRRRQIPRQILGEDKRFLLFEENAAAVKFRLFERSFTVIRLYDLSRPAVRRFDGVKAVFEVTDAKAILIHGGLQCGCEPDTTTGRYRNPPSHLPLQS